MTGKPEMPLFWWCLFLCGFTSRIGRVSEIIVGGTEAEDCCRVPPMNAEKGGTTVKGHKNRMRALSLVLAFALTAAVLPTAAYAAAPSIKSKTTTEGNLTTTVITSTEKDANYTDTVVSTYITDNSTGERTKGINGTYVNKPEHVTVKTLATKSAIEKGGRTEGTVTASVDATVYMKTGDTELDVQETMMNQAVNSARVAVDELESPKNIGVCIEISAEIKEAAATTVNIPTSVLKLAGQIPNSEFRIHTQNADLTLTSKAMDELLRSAGNKVSFTLKVAESDDVAYAEAIVNNGTRILSLTNGTARMDISFDEKFGAEAERMEVVSLDENGKGKNITDFSYNTAKSTLSFEGTDLGRFEILFGKADFSDMSGHWAKNAVARWSGLGVVKGSGGQFHPDDPVQRGDMAVILGKIMGYSAKAENTFDDLDSSKYYAEAVLAAKEAGILSGSGGSVRPEQNVTREEAASMLCGALGVSPQTVCNKEFTDDGAISEWAKGSVYALVNKGLMQGSGGRLGPAEYITRGEIAALLDQAVTELVSGGVYGEDVEGTLLVNGKNVTLKDMTVKGDLIVADGVGDSDITLDGVTVTGKTIVRGGGTESVRIQGKSRLQAVELQKISGPIRLDKDSSAATGLVSVVKGKGSAVLSGSYDKVTVDDSIPVRLESAKVKELTTAAENSGISVDSMSHVDRAQIDGHETRFDVAGEILALAIKGKNAQIEGTGKLDEAAVYAPGAVIKTNGTDIKAEAGSGSVLCGSGKGQITVAEGKTGTTPGTRPGVSSSGKVDESISPNAPKIETNLKDGDTIKSSRFTLVVYATDPAGKKIDASDVTVTLNEEPVKATWDDSNKSSYTLELSDGSNSIVVTAAADGETTRKSFSVNHPATADGEKIGQAVFSLELLTLGEGYLIEPQFVDILEGDSAADALDTFLSDNGYTYKNTGSLEKGFYLSAVTGLDSDIVPMMPTKIPQVLKSIMDEDDVEINQRSKEDSLGEFDYTYMSGWMYSVNNSFPNVGFSDTYLQDGDVVRVQFTLWGYGADLGGGYATGSGTTDFYETADKTQLLKKAARQGYDNLSDKVKEILTKVNASQSEVDKLL